MHAYNYLTRRRLCMYANALHGIVLWLNTWVFKGGDTVDTLAKLAAMRAVGDWTGAQMEEDSFILLLWHLRPLPMHATRQGCQGEVFYKKVWNWHCTLVWGMFWLLSVYGFRQLGMGSVHRIAACHPTSPPTSLWTSSHSYGETGRHRQRELQCRKGSRKSFCFFLPWMLAALHHHSPDEINNDQ